MGSLRIDLKYKHKKYLLEVGQSEERINYDAGKDNRISKNESEVGKNFCHLKTSYVDTYARIFLVIYL